MHGERSSEVDELFGGSYYTPPIRESAERGLINKNMESVERIDAVQAECHICKSFQTKEGSCKSFAKL